MFTLGFDEAGRGPLAGPVYVGAGMLLNEVFPVFTSMTQTNQELNFYSQNPEFKKIRDSKKISEKNRIELYNFLKNLEGSGGFKNQFFGKTLSLDNQAIDKFGIGVCLSHLLMVVLQFFEKKVFDLGLNDVKIKVIADGKIKLLEALDDELLVEIKKQNNLDLEIDKYFWKNILEEKSSDLFSDTNKNKRVVFDLIRENKADDRYLSVAVGSILAKVERDGFMENLDKKYPDFGWVKNKGYGTKENLKAIEKNLDNPYLRKTFLKRFFE